ncbi:MAG: sulfur oxidation c-type cytochrome SoxX [Pacificibacter sp.]|uniref:sulfur oxidation c-type cytochrome SoxX n=1 Tax=Pacificibacter sp. TaxID=1917866 RepID=UPI00321A536C
MKRIATTFVVLGLTAGAALAEVAPSDVAFEDGAIAQSLSGMAGNPEEGRKIMTSKKLGNCVSCHAAEDYADVPFAGDIGPVLDGAGSRWDEAQIRGIVANAKMMFEDTMMPSFYKTTGYIRPGDAFTGKAAKGELPPLLSAQQIEDVVAYLMTLKDE